MSIIHSLIQLAYLYISEQQVFASRRILGWCHFQSLVRFLLRSCSRFHTVVITLLFTIDRVYNYRNHSSILIWLNFSQVLTALKKKKKATRVLWEFANVRTNLPLWHHSTYFRPFHTVDRYTLYLLYCLIVHTHTLSTLHIYCTLYVLRTLSVHLSQTSLLFATHVHLLVHWVFTCLIP